MVFSLFLERTLIQGYDKDDIWNMDETGVFWKGLPDRGFGI